MKRDDHLAQLRALDPAGPKEVDRIVAAVASDLGGMLERQPHRRRLLRPRLALVTVAALAAALVVAALVTDPFAHPGTISSAQAQQQVAAALDLQGDWHVTREIREAGVTVTEDLWHARDGRLLIRWTLPGHPAQTWTTLYADGRRQMYDSAAKTLRTHRFVVAADERDDERASVPPTAADLFRAAYRVGKVRLAGVETLDGHRVYRLVFDWLDTRYTLVFDADRQVPLSSESSTQGQGPLRVSVRRVRYSTYERVQSSSELDDHLRLPTLPRSVKTIREPAIVVPTPVQGAAATQLTRKIASRFGGPHVLAAHATYAFVRRLPGGGVAALVRAPMTGAAALTECIAIVEIAHVGGEAFVPDSGCSTPGETFAAPSRSGRAMILAGTTSQPRVELRFAGGPTLRLAKRGALWFATPASSLFRHDLTIARTSRDGSRGSSLPFSLLHVPGEFPDWMVP